MNGMSRLGYQMFQATCACGATTTRVYARAHGGKCKACVTGVSLQEGHTRDTRNECIIDHGYAAYAREEGHYD